MEICTLRSSMLNTKLAKLLLVRFLDLSVDFLSLFLKIIEVKGDSVSQFDTMLIQRELKIFTENRNKRSFLRRPALNLLPALQNIRTFQCSCFKKYT